jgi:hypothetical protein
MKYYFKVVYTNIAAEINVDPMITISDFIIKVNTEWKSIFDIHYNYAVQIVLGGNNVNGDAELAPELSFSSELFGEKFRNKNVMFYLRPVNPITEEFTRVDDYSIDPQFPYYPDQLSSAIL